MYTHNNYSNIKFSRSLKDSISKNNVKNDWVRSKIVIFLLTFIVGLVIALANPLRPEYSESEKRKLAEFPRFSLQASVNGKYFRSIDTWFADTFPGRDSLISLKTRVQSLYGFHPTEIHGKIEEGDAIPDVSIAENTSTGSDTGNSDSNAENAEQTQPGNIIASDSTAPDNTVTAENNNTPPKNENEFIGNTQTLGALLLAGDSAYEYYNFNKQVAINYINAINSTSQKLNGVSTIYDIIVPTSMDIVLPQSVRKDLNSSDQQKAINFMYGSMNENVKTVAVYDILQQHSDEYIYFRTDHHWTALGAYYTYQQFAKNKGISPIPLESFKASEFPGFIGSFYTESGKKPDLKKNPDTVIAYNPPVKSSMYYIDANGQKVNWSVISDVSNWNPSSKYSTFIGGDHPYTYISNKESTDNSSCIVVKESYGNAFVPFIVPHYRNIHVIDYRYWKGNLADFAKKNSVDTVIFVNNISMTRSKALVNMLTGIIN